MVTTRRRVHLWWWAALPVIVASALARADAPPFEEAAAKIGELRAQGRYGEALAECRDLQRWVEHDSATPDWQRGEVRRTIRTLEAVVLWPLDDQRALAIADSLSNALPQLYAEEKYDEGLKLAEQQLAIRERLLGPDHVETWESRNAIALMRDGLGQAEGLVELERSVLAANRRLIEADNPAVETSMVNLAALLDVLGRQAEAEPLYREALVIVRRREHQDPAGVATTLNDLGTNLHGQGKHGEAEEALREALALRLGPAASDPIEVAQLENNLGSVLVDQGDYAGAVRILRRALSRHEAAGIRNPLGYSAVLQSLGSANYYLGRHGAAEQYYRRARRIRERQSGPMHPQTAHIYVNEAAALRELHRDAEAESLLIRAFASMRTAYGETHPDIVWCLKQLGELYLASGRVGQAESTLSRAAEAFDLTRLLVTAGDNQSRHLASPYPALAVAELELNRGEPAWNAAERALARALADVVMFSGPSRRDSVDRERERALRLRLQDAQQDLRRLSAGDPGSPDVLRKRMAARDTLERVEAEWTRLEHELDRASGIARGQVYSLERAQSRLLPDEALMGWLPDEPQTRRGPACGYVIRQTGPVRWVTLDSSRAAARRVRAAESLWVAGVRLGQDVSRESGIIWRGRLDPLVRHLDGVRHVIAVPAGDVLGLPLEAIGPRNGAELGQRFVVSYAPSATLFAWLREQSADPWGTGNRPWRVLAACDPPFNAEQLAAMNAESHELEEAASGLSAANETGGAVPARSRRQANLRDVWHGGPPRYGQLRRLRDSRLESATLSRLAAPGSRILEGAEASEATVQHLARADSMAQFRVLHFATHALVDDGQPELSALVLSQVTPKGVPVSSTPGGEDGAVSVREVLSTWRLEADLVVLSACSTGLGKRLSGEGYVGLARAFMQVGARALLVSLWDVDDRSTALLMRRFYENWLGGARDKMGMPEALREAKAWLRAGAGGAFRTPHDDPFFWAGFVLIGG